MSRALLLRRIEAAEAQAQRLRELERQRAATLDFASMSYDELKAALAGLYAHHGLTEDEAFIVARNDCYYRHETGTDGCLSPRFPAAARRAIADLIERRIRALQTEERVPPEKAERLRDLAYMRRVSDLARRYLPAWNRRGSPGGRELALAMRELDGTRP